MDQDGLGSFGETMFTACTHDNTFIDPSYSGVEQLRLLFAELEDDNHAIPFGVDDDNPDAAPTSYVTTLFEMCRRNKEKMIASFAMMYFAPHKHVINFNGEEMFRQLDREYYQKVEIPAAKAQNREPDLRAIRRAPISPEEFKKVFQDGKIVDPHVKAIADLANARAEHYPDELEYYDINEDAKKQNILDVRLGGKKDDKRVDLRLVVNGDGKKGKTFEKSTDDKLLVSSSTDDELEAYGYRLWAVNCDPGSQGS